jgi:hypothetical protein
MVDPMHKPVLDPRSEDRGIEVGKNLTPDNHSETPQYHVVPILVGIGEICPSTTHGVRGLAGRTAPRGLPGNALVISNVRR